MAQQTQKVVKSKKGDTEKKGNVAGKHKRKVTSIGLSANTRVKNKSKRRSNGGKSKVK